MNKVISKDGTTIAFYQGGAGSPLILVSGAGANPVHWTSVVPTLEQNFCVYSIYRRGRGESGDNPTYALEREYEDILAVIDAIGEPVNLLAHSFGGLLALEVALLTRKIRKLVLYEGVPTPEVLKVPAGTTNRLEALLDAGDREAMMTSFYGEVAGMSPDEIEQLRSSPVWSERLAIAHTLLREMRAVERYVFDLDRFKNLQTPTLLLLGGASPQYMTDAAEALDKVLPNSQIVVLPGQRHVAMYSAPDLFLKEVLAFLTGPN